MTTQQAQTDARNGAELGSLRRNSAQAAAEGEAQRGERMSYAEAALERAGELAMAGYLRESRALLARELGAK